MFYMSLFWLYLLAIPPQEATKTITTQEAKTHVGQKAKVCGVIATIYEPTRSKRNPTMLNFDAPYPKNEFTAIIWREERTQFGDLRALLAKRVCVTGEVYAYRGRAQMKLQTSQQLSRN